MPIHQYRRRFHTPSEINRLIKDGGAIKTHTMQVVLSDVETARLNLSKMSTLQAHTFKRFKSGNATLAELKIANAAKAKAVNELEAIAPQALPSTSSDRKSLYW